MAAAVVLASGWDRKSPPVDPFCGSGTLLIEAALIAGNIAPGVFRERFGFERWPGHEAAAWNSLRDEVRARAALPKKLMLQGFDAERDAIAGTRENAVAAGLGTSIQFGCAPIERFEPKKGWNAWLATNVPYGERIGDERDLMPTFERFGSILRERCHGWHLAILYGNENLSRALGFDFTRRIPLQNGSIECRLMLADLA